MKYTNEKMTFKDMDKYSKRELFNMWQEQNPNKTVAEVAKGISFSNDISNEYIRFTFAYECKLDIYKPKEKETSIADIMSLIGIEVR